MAAVPFDLKLALREGSIFLFQSRALTSEKPHFHIVANSDPLGQKLLLLTVVTSKVDKVKIRRRSCPQTLVELCPDDLPKVLTKPSIIDCNGLIPVLLDAFCERWKAKEIKCFGEDSPDVLKRALRAAIHASDILSDEQKALVAQP